MKPFEIASHNKTRIQDTAGEDLWYADVKSKNGHKAFLADVTTLEAIAKLLAAAPMLYSALEGLVEAYMETNGFCLDDRLIAAKGALAAAK